MTLSKHEIKYKEMLQEIVVENYVYKMFSRLALISLTNTLSMFSRLALI